MWDDIPDWYANNGDKYNSGVHNDNFKHLPQDIIRQKLRSMYSVGDVVCSALKYVNDFFWNEYDEYVDSTFTNINFIAIKKYNSGFFHYVLFNFKTIKALNIPNYGEIPAGTIGEFYVISWSNNLFLPYQAFYSAIRSDTKEIDAGNNIEFRSSDSQPFSHIGVEILLPDTTAYIDINIKDRWDWVFPLAENYSGMSLPEN
ncbi:MAG: hypothetical protein LBS95_01935 [Mycoplasmataceae bacterium]|jgi:hypothetical protein|nr:hypothetical protein [Mycoplasmataceae bacterium]